ncbi:MAG TPA: AgmX/PglI C-terminal domain-containing protein [Polyangiaceae bacterium]|nr:AgmX/PglI C-terminal domain-containing protein [Polyangiaceae bacterium]
MQSPSLPPEIPKRSLAPLWIGVGAVLALGGVLWGVLPSSSKPEPKAAPSVAATSEAPEPAPVPAAHVADPAPPPPPPLEHALPPPPRVGAIPAQAAAAPAAAGAQPARRDPSCVDPCKGRETPELLSALRSKAGQARSCYERALSNNSMLSGKLEVALRVGASGAACSASVASDTLGDAAVKSCAVARFLGVTYPKPIGGCVDISVPMNFMPGGSR